MILVTKTSGQTRQRGHTLSTCTNVCVCVRVFFRLIDRASTIPRNNAVANPIRGLLDRKRSEEHFGKERRICMVTGDQ